jgi:hypothetical protein
MPMTAAKEAVRHFVHRLVFSADDGDNESKRYSLLWRPGDEGSSQ